MDVLGFSLTAQPSLYEEQRPQLTLHQSNNSIAEARVYLNIVVGILGNNITRIIFIILTTIQENSFQDKANNCILVMRNVNVKPCYASKQRRYKRQNMLKSYHMDVNHADLMNFRADKRRILYLQMSTRTVAIK